MQLELSDFDTSIAEVHVEYSIGNINDDSGGRIDILLSDGKGKFLVIENKIYAGDQDKQLIRYKNKFRDSLILYLTLDGKEPEDYSKGELVKELDFKCISFRKDVLKWLETCKKESVNHPMLRETISQYINLIKQLTNQTTNENMENEIIDFIFGNNKNLKSYFEIHSNQNLNFKINLKVFSRLKDNIIKEFEKKEGEFKIEFSEEIEFGLSDSYFKVYSDKWESEIRFQFAENFELDNPIIGVKAIDFAKNVDEKKIQEIMSNIVVSKGRIENWDGWLWNTRLIELGNLNWVEDLQEKAPMILYNVFMKIITALYGAKL